MNATPGPLVSIIVPSFNQARFIRKTLESILSQDYRPIEVVVIDGASTDGTVDILHDYDGVAEVRWLSEPDNGVVEAVNKGFTRARGEIAAIQSSDDFYLPGAIRAGVEALESDHALAFIYGDIARVDADGREISQTDLRPFSLEAVLSRDTWVPQPSTFFRLAIAREMGGWRNEVPYAADTDLWFRMALRYPARKIDKVLALYSVHEGQRDTQSRKIVRDHSAVVDALRSALPSSRLRRAALAGKLLTVNRYSSSDPAVTRLLRLWKAALVYPALFRRLPIGAFVPGIYSLQTLASRVKSALLAAER